MNTCYPARIVTFDAETQTAVVKVMMERFFSDLDEDYQKIPTKELVDVPCHFPKGGGHSVTMPVDAGDDCLVFFAQRGIDHWLYEGEEVAGDLLGRPSPQHKRRYSKSDALALIGFGSGILSEQPKVIKDFQPKAIEIRNEDRTQRVSLWVESKDIEVVTDADLRASIGGELNANVVGNTTLTTPLLTLNGDMQVNGKIDSTGAISSDDDCVSAGISGKGHIHAHGNPNTSAPL